MNADYTPFKFRTCGLSITRALPALVLLALATGAGTGTPAQTTSSTSTPASAITAQLEYQTSPNPVARFAVPAQFKTAPFQKEPSASGRVQRGTLTFAPKPIAFLWSGGHGRLYLDLNGNQDLTDDPAGVYLSSTPSTQSYRQQCFTNIDLAAASPSGRKLLLHLACYAYGNNNLAFSAEVRSYWAGKISLRDAEWQVGLVESPSATGAPTGQTTMFLRPWSEQRQPLVTDDGSLQGFNLSGNLFFNGERYRVSALNPAGGLPGFDLRFEPQESVTGEMRITGKMVDRLLMVGHHQSERITVLLVNPADTVAAPVGNYDEFKLVLEAGGRKAIPEGQRHVSPGGRSVKIEASKPAFLNSGGPLTNVVDVSRSGGHLNLSYHLFGAGGQRYELVGAALQPQFKVFLGEKQLASGKFEFG